MTKYMWVLRNGSNKREYLQIDKNSYSPSLLTAALFNTRNEALESDDEMRNLHYSPIEIPDIPVRVKVSIKVANK